LELPRIGTHERASQCLERSTLIIKAAVLSGFRAKCEKILKKSGHLRFHQKISYLWGFQGGSGEGKGTLLTNSLGDL